MNSEKRLILRAEIFHETFVPPALPERQKQVSELAWCLSPLLKGNTGMNSWLHGPTGSGKTVVVRHVLESLREKSSIPHAYVNCYDRFTFHPLSFMLAAVQSGCNLLLRLPLAVRSRNDKARQGRAIKRSRGSWD